MVDRRVVLVPLWSVPRSRTARRTAGSRPVVGSSRASSSGPAIIAAAGFVEELETTAPNVADDRVIHDFAHHAELAHLTNVPNLVDHEAGQSLIGNSFRGSRRAAVFTPDAVAPASWWACEPLTTLTRCGLPSTLSPLFLATSLTKIAILLISQFVYSVFASGFQSIGMILLVRVEDSDVGRGTSVYQAIMQTGTTTGVALPSRVPGYSSAVILIAAGVCVGCMALVGALVPSFRQRSQP